MTPTPMLSQGLVWSHLQIEVLWPAQYILKILNSLLTFTNQKIFSQKSRCHVFVFKLDEPAALGLRVLLMVIGWVAGGAQIPETTQAQSRPESGTCSLSGGHAFSAGELSQQAENWFWEEGVRKPAVYEAQICVQHVS